MGGKCKGNGVNMEQKKKKRNGKKVKGKYDESSKIHRCLWRRIKRGINWSEKAITEERSGVFNLKHQKNKKEKKFTPPFLKRSTSLWRLSKRFEESSCSWEHLDQWNTSYDTETSFGTTYHWFWKKSPSNNRNLGTGSVPNSCYTARKNR